MSWKSLFQLRKKRSNPRSTSTQTADPEVAALFEDVLGTGANLRVRVTGGSMSPFLEDGDVVTIRKVPPSSLKTGDLIFFRNNHHLPRLHRILHKWQTSDGRTAFQTKGDALIAFDGPVKHHNVLGKVCDIENTSSIGTPACANMECRRWQVLNLLLAWIGLTRSIAHLGISRIKKILLLRECVP